MSKKHNQKKFNETLSKGISVNDLFKDTTFNSGHKHRWLSNKGYTTTDQGHKHKINVKKMMAMPAGRDLHIHRLIKKRKKNK